jgi:hypothetical protein
MLIIKLCLCPGPKVQSKQIVCINLLSIQITSQPMTMLVPFLVADQIKIVLAWSPFFFLLTIHLHMTYDTSGILWLKNAKEMFKPSL